MEIDNFIASALEDYRYVSQQLLPFEKIKTSYALPCSMLCNYQLQSHNYNDATSSLGCLAGSECVCVCVCVNELPVPSFLTMKTSKIQVFYDRSSANLLITFKRLRNFMGIKCTVLEHRVNTFPQEKRLQHSWYESVTLYFKSRKK